MKKTIAILSLVTLFSVFTAFAQDPMNSFSTKSPQKHESKHANKSIISAEKRAERMAQDLNLSADEKIKVEALFEKQDLKLQIINELENGNKKTKIKKMNVNEIVNIIERWWTKKRKLREAKRGRRSW